MVAILEVQSCYSLAFIALEENNQKILVVTTTTTLLR